MKRSLLLLTLCCTAFLDSLAQTDYTLVMDRVRAQLLASAGNLTTLDNNVTSTLATLQTNGSWPDVNYAYSSTTYTADTHINRVKSFALAYTHTGSSYYHDSTLFDAIARSLQYWNTSDPQSWNWYHNQISNPQRLGEILILLYIAPDTLTTALRDDLLAQMNRGNPAAQTGANKMDVAAHFIYRACLTANATLMSDNVAQMFQPITLTTSEGIQPDLSYQQHGTQLYVFGYGSVLVDGEIKFATYLDGTPWELSGAKLALFSDFVRNGYTKVMRAKYIDFSVNGRSISRANNISQGGVASQLTKLKALDPSNLAEYNNIIARVNGSQPPSYMVTPSHTHFWHSDYTIHHRPGYFFGLRAVSPRTSKSENGNGENLKGYYLSEGATNIAVSGSEYYNIFPVWDWARIPGTTVPYITTFPLRASWGGNHGTATFCGGVADSLYGATAMAFNDYSTQARKAWFFFDDEVVCLGADIKSTAAQAINTTVNQCLLSGNVTVFAGGSQSTLSTGSHSYSGNLKWVSHNGIGYYFPAGGNLHLNNQSQSGTWKSINNGGSTTTQNMNVFKLWFDHGTAPTGGSYAYYVLPGQNMAAWDTTQIRIQSNTADVQAVRHMGLNIRQLVFYKAGTFTMDSVTVTVDRACVLMLKNTDSTSVTVSVADPAQSSSPVNVYLDLPNIPQTRHLEASMPSGTAAGSTVTYTVNSSTPVYDPPTAIPATADAYVRNGTSYAGVNYGSATSLVIKKDGVGYSRETFFKFDVSALPAGTDNVKLRLYVNYANTGVASVPWIAQFVSNDSWTETGINWNNMPAATSNIDTVQGMAAGNYAEWDVTAVALAEKSGDGMLSLKVVSNGTGSTTDASFSSKETGNTALRPVLEYTTGSLLRKMPPAAVETPAITHTKVFPVPAGNFLRVQTDRVYNKAELRDVSGRVVKLLTLEGRQQFEIDVQQLPPGVYMLQLSGPKGKELRKIVKL